jgi:outer membrane protein TolC
VTELTDYQRLVEKPHLARLHAQLAECHAVLAKLQAERDEAREVIRGLLTEWPEDSVPSGPLCVRASRALGGGE